MAIYTGPVDIDISSYDSFRNTVLGNGYNMDGAYGCQCWDLGAELWYNVGSYSYPYLLTGPNGYAYECWTVSRVENAQDNFELIYDKTQIKRGDMIILGPTTANPPGHNGFADEDYNGTDYIAVVGQNQGGSPSTPGGGTVTTLNTLGLDQFLGAFRYKAWQETPPTPTEVKHHFKWVLYAKHLRNRSIM